MLPGNKLRTTSPTIVIVSERCDFPVWKRWLGLRFVGGRGFIPAWWNVSDSFATWGPCWEWVVKKWGEWDAMLLGNILHEISFMIPIPIMKPPICFPIGLQVGSTRFRNRDTTSAVALFAAISRSRPAGNVEIFGPCHAPLQLPIDLQGPMNMCKSRN